MDEVVVHTDFALLLFFRFLFAVGLARVRPVLDLVLLFMYATGAVQHENAAARRAYGGRSRTTRRTRAGAAERGQSRGPDSRRLNSTALRPLFEFLKTKICRIRMSCFRWFVRLRTIGRESSPLDTCLDSGMLFIESPTVPFLVR